MSRHAWARRPAAGLLLASIFVALPRAAQNVGVFQDGRYRHDATGVEFEVPAGWSIGRTLDSSDGGQQAQMQDLHSPATYVAVWMKAETNTSAEADAWLLLAPKMKVAQRLEGGFVRFAFRPDRTERKFVNGHSAVSAVADFVLFRGRGIAGLPAPEKTVEYFTWVFTEKTRVQFDVRGAEVEAAAVAARLDDIIYASRIP